MTKIDIYSGFLGAGKTTLIKKMIQEAYRGQKLVLIENEFGEIGIDGGFLQDAGIQITEMNSGCICCSLVGDFGKALTKVIHEYDPERIIIEPSGVGKLSDVIAAVKKVTNENVTLGYTVAVADAGKVKIYTKNFGEFYNDQIETADTILLSRTDSVPQAKLDTAMELLRAHNDHATIVTTPWDQLTGAQIVEAMEGQASLRHDMDELEHDHEEHEGHCCHHHDHDHEEHEGHCCHHHDHNHEEHEGHCCHHHDHDHEEHEGHCCHHHDHDHEEHEGHCCHPHDHDHEEHEGHCCHHHDHDHEHHHHADEVFTSWGTETHKKYSYEFLMSALKELDSGKYGVILRAKGILASDDGKWLYFDMVPEEYDVRFGGAAITGKLCVIGSKLDEQGIATLFGV